MHHSWLFQEEMEHCIWITSCLVLYWYIIIEHIYYLIMGAVRHTKRIYCKECAVIVALTATMLLPYKLIIDSECVTRLQGSSKIKDIDHRKCNL